MKKTLLVFIICTLAGCAKKQGKTTADDIAEEAVVESGVGVVSGMSDEQAGESFAMIQSSKTEEMYAAIQNLILPRAEADNTCGRAVFASCNAGVREANHVNCQVGASNAVMNGYVRLTYSQPGCVLSSTGDTVDRTYNQTINGSRGGVATVSSDVSSDYLGQAYGGGGRLSKTAGGFSAEILGKHISLVRNGNALTVGAQEAVWTEWTAR